MTNPSASASSTIVAAIAVSVAVATIQAGTVDAAENCLAAPKTATPTGQHWFYRLEAGTKRHCWYLGDEDKTSSRVSRSNSTRRAASDPSPTRNEAPARSRADARAEMQRPQTLSEDDKNLAAPAENATPRGTPEDSGSAAPDRTATPIPDRWPEASELAQPNGIASSAGTPPSAAAMQEANAVEPTPAETSTPVTSAGAPPETTVASTAIRATGPANSEIEIGPSPIGLTLISLGGLILLGLSGGAIYRVVDRRARWRSYGSSFGPDPADDAQLAAPSDPDVEDDLHQMRQLLVRLQHGEALKREDAVIQLYSGASRQS